MPVTLDGRRTKTVRHGVGVNAQEKVAAAFQPHTVLDEFGHDTAVGVCPASHSEPLVGFNKTSHRPFTRRFHRAEKASHLHQMPGCFRFQFGIQGSIDAVDGLSVHLGRPRRGENIERTPKRSGLEKGGEFLPCRLHGFLDDVAGGFSEFPLKGRPVGERLQQFSPRERHLCVVHRPFNLLVDGGLERLDGAPQFVFDPGDFLNLRVVAQPIHRLGQFSKREQGFLQGSQCLVFGQFVALLGLNQIAEHAKHPFVVHKPVDGAFWQDQGRVR